MRTFIPCILLALILFACEDQDAAEPDPTEEEVARQAANEGCVESEDALTGSGIGAVQIGMAADELMKRCPQASDTTVTDIEGDAQPIILVPAGSDTLRAEIVRAEVWRISTEDPTWRTDDSLGVGSPISELLELPDVRGMTGEGNLVVVSPRHCGLSFQLEGEAPPPANGWDAEALARLPEATEVSLVRIVGCAETGS